MSNNSLSTFLRGYKLANFGYEAFSQGVSTSGYLIQTTHDNYQHYNAIELKEHIDGLNGYALVPTNPSNKEIHVVFTGTQDTAGLARDFEPLSAGGDSFNLACQDMAEHFKAILNTLPADSGYKLCISGHSLGAADAENFLALMLNAKANNGEYTQIDEIELFSFNSPGLSRPADEGAEGSLSKLLEEDQNFKIDLHYARAENDYISNFGEGHIAVDYIEGRANTDYLHVFKTPDYDNVAELNGGYAVGHAMLSWWTAHKFDFFDDNGNPNFEKFSYLTAQNEGEFDTLESILHDKSHFFQSLMYYPKLALHSALSAYTNYTNQKNIDIDDVINDSIFEHESIDIMDCENEYYYESYYSQDYMREFDYMYDDLMA